MNTIPYQPQLRSLAGQVLQFLARNPDEMLTRADIVIKFCAADATMRPKHVATALRQAVVTGHLVYQKVGDDRVYLLPQPEVQQQLCEPAEPEQALLPPTATAPSVAIPEPAMTIVPPRQFDAIRAPVYQASPAPASRPGAHDYKRIESRGHRC